jgi:hypothetical protein
MLILWVLLLLLAGAGAGGLYLGLDLAGTERGSTATLAGALALSSACLLAGLMVIASRLGRLRVAIEQQTEADLAASSTLAATLAGFGAATVGASAVAGALHSGHARAQGTEAPPGLDEDTAADGDAAVTAGPLPDPLVESGAFTAEDLALPPAAEPADPAPAAPAPADSAASDPAAAKPAAADLPGTAAAAAGAAAEGGPAPTVVGTYTAGGRSFTMYSDGAVEATMDGVVRRFRSLDELKGYIAAAAAGRP